MGWLLHWLLHLSIAANLPYLRALIPVPLPALPCTGGCKTAGPTRPYGYCALLRSAELAGGQPPAYAVSDAGCLVEWAEDAGWMGRLSWGDPIRMQPAPRSPSLISLTHPASPSNRTTLP